MNYHPGLAVAKPAKLKPLTGGRAPAAGSTCLQHGTAKYKEKEDSKSLFTARWLTRPEG